MITIFHIDILLLIVLALAEKICHIVVYGLWGAILNLGVLILKNS